MLKFPRSAANYDQRLDPPGHSRDQRQFEQACADAAALRDKLAKWCEAEVDCTESGCDRSDPDEMRVWHSFRFTLTTLGNDAAEIHDSLERSLEQLLDEVRACKKKGA